MHINGEQPSIVFTRGHEQPPLEYGPQRIHYIYSVGIPQAYLTLFSILQGLVFSILLTAIPFPKEVDWSALGPIASQQYLYLPYIISLGMLILIWLHQISITFTGGWPHSFPQISLVILLALFQVFAARTIATLPLWLFFTGCVSIVGGITLVRTGIMQRLEDFDSSSPFQKFGHSLKRSEIQRGRQYILIGVSLTILAVGYNGAISLVKTLNPPFVIFVPWIIYIFVFILLFLMILTRYHRSKYHREAKDAMYESTDMDVQKGIARYRKTGNGGKIVSYTNLAPKENSQNLSKRKKQVLYRRIFRALISMSIISAFILSFMHHRRSFRGQ